MLSLLSPSDAQDLITIHVRDRRLALGLTQAGLANRADVALPTLRRFEQKGLASLDVLLKLLAVVGGLDDMVQSLEVKPIAFASIDDVLKKPEKLKRKNGWRT